MFKTFVVLDDESSVVLWQPSTLTTANALASGIPESSGKVIISESKTIEPLKVAAQRGNRYVFESFPSEKYTARLAISLGLASIRGPALFELELALSSYTDEGRDFYDQELDAYIAHTLRDTRPALGNFSPGVKEYAEILGISPMAAYQELKLRLESRGRAKLMNYALYRKYVSVINSLTTSEQILSKMKEWRDGSGGWKL